MNSCSNCKRSLGCTCQKRTASDGTQCCAACLVDYEKRLQELKKIKEQQQKHNP